eukprot:TRINITY_DN22891_c0_g2_i1.p1 TRINITY_DN22891_c0_g2~~TRINITY_DN22891_c0_g2_i1.p1  ORF type:complete len:305 (-),score=11.24 TRINITY_DN22891_c0_g2_i1:533-1447(-)
MKRVLSQSSTNMESPGTVEDELSDINGIWDNTLFITDHLKKVGFQFESYFDPTQVSSESDQLVDGFLIKKIHELEEVRNNAQQQELITFLSHASGFGHVAVISNASKSWVLKCLKHYYPRLYALMETPETGLKVEIVSARDLFYAANPGDPLRWKVLLLVYRQVNAFVRVLSTTHFHTGVRNIFSIGDSVIERRALFTASRQDSSFFDPNRKLNSHVLCVGINAEYMGIELPIRVKKGTILPGGSEESTPLYYGVTNREDVSHSSMKVGGGQHPNKSVHLSVNQQKYFPAKWVAGIGCIKEISR